MSDIEKRIADVLGDHEYWQRKKYRDWECACGKIFGLKINLDHHVAEVLMRELHLWEHKSVDHGVRAIQGWVRADTEEPGFKQERWNQFTHADTEEPQRRLCECESSNWQTEIMEQCSIHAPRVRADTEEPYDDDPMVSDSYLRYHDTEEPTK